VSALAVGALFIITGSLHFVYPDAYRSIVPAYLPAHAQLVTASGACEILGGLGVMLAAVRRYAGWGLIALLLAVFPANIDMALHAERFARLAPAWALDARLPLQIVLVWWVYRVTQERREQ
jgi:uncharacterized membrane protein